MENIFENLVFEGFEYNEAKEKMGEGVLGVVKGPSFFSDGYSRNGRFYPKELWENALKNSNTMQKLERGLMFGCIGHPKEYTLDALLESGKVSHKVTNISIDPKTGNGIAEYHILDTPSGRILNTILRSGSQMYVSTRAFGGFTNETKKKDGKEYKVLDSTNFELESIDFVIEPGFLQTNPKLVESISEDLAKLAEDKAQIRCEEGICSLGEELMAMNEAKAEEEAGQADILEGIEDLSKEDIIEMLRNVVAENELLSKETVISEVEDTDKEDDDVSKDSNGEMEVDAKLITNYVSYVELLTKLVRYNVEYEKFYDQLIEFLDKDEKISTSDMADIKKIAEDISKQKDVEESILKICEKIINITDRIEQDGEEREKEDGEAKEESFVEFMLNLAERGSVLLEQQMGVNKDLRKQIEHLKYASAKLAEHIAEPEVVEKIVEVEKVVEKVVHDTPKEITSKMVELKERVIDLEAQLEEAELKAIKTMNESEESTVAISEEKQMLEEALSKLTKAKSVAESKLNEKISSLQTSLDEANAKAAKRSKAVETVTAELKEAKNEAHSHRVAYLSAVHRVEKKVVESIIEKHGDDDDKVANAIKKEAKLIKRHTPVTEHQVPEYKPKQTSKAKSAYLESLTK